MQTLPDLVQIAREHARARPAARAYTWLRNGETEAGTLTFGELDRSARVIGRELERRGLRGERALLMYAPGLPFISAFMGCLSGGVVPVPLSTPRNEQAAETLAGIVSHADPALLLTDASTQVLLRSLGGLHGLTQLPSVATDALVAGDLCLWRPRPVEPDSLALLQYTSGSTGAPKGVEVTHANLIANERMMCAAQGHREGDVIVSWLPLFHDMGLIGNVLQSLFTGIECVLMAPAAFIQRPLRWLWAIHRHGGTTSGGPNFGYELCVSKLRPADLDQLDLRSWRRAFNGSEPIRASTLASFSRAFAPAGFRAESFYPCYGLAEATLFVSGGRVEERYVTRPATDARQDLVGCGFPWGGGRVRIVDPDTRVELPAGSVGEIWVQGPHVARGYRNWPAERPDPFRARLASGEGPFLRTGDLGSEEGGQLWVTGRLKDVLILHGRNRYPQDIEWAAGESHPALRSRQAAAFSVVPADATGERLVVVQEVQPRAAVRARGSRAAAAGLRRELRVAIRRAVARRFGLRVWRVVLIEPGTLPMTTSGKVRRRQARERFLAGTLQELFPRPAAGLPSYPAP